MQSGLESVRVTIITMTIILFFTLKVLQVSPSPCTLEDSEVVPAAPTLLCCCSKKHRALQNKSPFLHTAETKVKCLFSTIVQLNPPNLFCLPRIFCSVYISWIFTFRCSTGTLKNSPCCSLAPLCTQIMSLAGIQKETNSLLQSAQCGDRVP